MAYVREPAVSGVFYPGNERTLRVDVEDYLNTAHIPDIPGEVIGIVSPHAGYMYSGQVAAYGYKSLMGASVDTVIVIAPSHRVAFEGVAVMEQGFYRTPLGAVSVNEKLAKAVNAESEVIVSSVEPHKGEHSLEVQLPFLQVALEEFSLVPFIMGSQRPAICVELARAITSALRGIKKRVLIVGSTDLSHYHPYDTAVKLDRRAIRHLEAFNIEGMVKGMEEEEFEACGAGPIIVTMMVAKALGADASKVMKYLNSGDVSGDKSGVVGYVSTVLYKKNAE